MTKSLVDALRTRDNVTENGMVTNSSTLNACVDLFFTIVFVEFNFNFTPKLLIF